MLDQSMMQGHDEQKLPAERIYARVCEAHLADPDTIYVFDNHLGVFGGGTRLAMTKTRLHAGLIVIEAWFRGY